MLFFAASGAQLIRVIDAFGLVETIGRENILRLPRKYSPVQDKLWSEPVNSWGRMYCVVAWMSRKRRHGPMRSRSVKIECESSQGRV